MQVDTDPQVTKVVLIEGRERDKWIEMQLILFIEMKVLLNEKAVKLV